MAELPDLTSESFQKFKVVKQENPRPERIRIRAEKDFEGHTYSEEFPFEPSQLESGSWKQHVDRWVEKVENGYFKDKLN